MASFRVAYNSATKVTTLLADADAIPSGFTVVGSFDHDSLTDKLGFAGNHVLYHHVRNLMRSTDQNMQRVTMLTDAKTGTEDPVIDSGSISPSSGTVKATKFYATPAKVDSTKGTLVGTRWWINGKPSITNKHFVVAYEIGSLVLESFIRNKAGVVNSVFSQAVTINADTGTPATPNPTISITGTVSKNEGNSGNTDYTLTINLNRDGSTAIIPFNWAVSGTGSNPANAADFVGNAFPAGSGSFASNETSKSVTFSVNGDTTVEQNENFLFSVTTTGAGNASVTGTIINDDSATPALTLSAASGSVAANVAAGYQLFTINNVPAGVTPTVTPNDGRFAIAGNASTGWAVVTGSTALSAGSVNVTVAATGATSAVYALTITAASAATAFVPTNYDVVFFGDSRTEDGVSSNAVQTNGYGFGTKNIGYAAWLHTMSAGKLRLGRYPNFGISASTLAQMAQEPRLDAVGAASTGRWDRPGASNNYASNKGALFVKNHDAGIVMILAGTNWPSGTVADQLGYIETIMNNIGSAKLIVLCNETPRGIDYTGAVANGGDDATNRYAFSQALLKYDYASGDAKARANVIAVDTWSEFSDTPTPPIYNNKRGYLRDGLHDTPYGSMRKMQVVIDRLKAAWGNTAWNNIPSKIVYPTANGLTTPASSQPFVNDNPIMTAGTNGQVLGTYATAPAQSGVPQAWTLNTPGGASGVVCVAEKGVETDPNGFGVCKLDFSGTIAANSNVAFQLYQLIGGTKLSNLLANNQLTINDKLRAMMTSKVELGSQYLQAVGLKLIAQDTTSSRTQTATARVGVLNLGGGGLNSYLDAAGAWRTDMTELMDLQDPNLVAQNQNFAVFQQLQVMCEILFVNPTAAPVNISATVRVGATGVFRTNS